MGSIRVTISVKSLRTTIKGCRIKDTRTRIRGRRNKYPSGKSRKTLKVRMRMGLVQSL